MARRKQSRKPGKVGVRPWIVWSLIFLAFVAIGVVSQQFAVDSSGNQLKDGSFISVKTYGFLKCGESESIQSYPATGFNKFSSLTIDCQQYGSLIQECDVTLKMPAKDDFEGKYSGLVYRKCTKGTVCNLEDIKPLYATYLWIDQDNNANEEVNIHLSPGQFLRAEYQESSGLIGAAKTVNKGRYRVTFKPYQISRYDVFSQTNGQVVPNTIDCTTNGDISELNLIIESVKGGGSLGTKLKESDILDKNNLRARGATMTYLSNFVAIMPQYDLFEDDTKYCYDKKIYRVEEVETPSGTYKVADTSTNKQIDTVECCNNGDVPQGYFCQDFKKRPLSTSEGAECSSIKPCPIVGFQAVAGKKVAFQECVSGKCVTDFEDVECNYNEECPGGYCDRDGNDPSKSKCKYVEPEDYCGNNACEATFGETIDTCPKDCRPGTQADYFWFYLGGAVMLAFIIILAVKAGRRR